MPRPVATFVPGWETAPDAPGVYMLYGGDECLYVGATRRLRQRVKSHNQRHGCTHFLFIECPVESLQSTEQEAIDRLKPTRNRGPAYRPQRTRAEMAAYYKARRDGCLSVRAA